MIALEYLIVLNDKAAQGQLARRDNFNRECSFCKSGAGYVIHSGVHRSTAFISANDHPDSFHSAQYWLNAGPAERDAFIIQIVGGASLYAAEERAFRAGRPDWQLIAPSAIGTQGNRQYTAVKRAGGFETRVGAYTLPHLHDRTK